MSLFISFKLSYPMFVDTRKKDVSIWLVKFPSFLSERIRNSDEIDIGELEITPGDNNTPPTTRFCIRNMPDLPQQYELTFTNIASPLYVLDGSKVEGRVTRECRVQPVLNAEYFAFQRARSAALNRARTTQVIDFRDKVRTSASEIDSLARKRRRNIVENKRERLERSEAIDLIFKAFEKNKMWTVRDLSDFTGQPVAYVQELVDEVCVLNKTDYRNLYELKPEFKNGD